MDEEDGRPGPHTRKFVPPDVPTDAFAKSLRQAFPISGQQYVLSLLTCGPAQYALAAFAPNHQPKSTPAPFFWRGPAEGVPASQGPTAGGGEAS
jgi:hypothetical protein